jgi:hypothetical protein
MRTEQEKTLPKNSAVCAQWKRCGRTGCRCTRGELHGPYACLFWRERGRLRERYLRLAEAEAVRAEYAERRSARREMRQLLREQRREWLVGTPRGGGASVCSRS